MRKTCFKKYKQLTYIFLVIYIEKYRGHVAAMKNNF